MNTKRIASLALAGIVTAGLDARAEEPAYGGSLKLETDCVCRDYQLPDFEPSGIVWSGPVGQTRGYLYAVSDNGQVAMRPVDPPLEVVRWTCLYRWCQDPKGHAQEKAQNDFESIAYVPATSTRKARLFIGVEGDKEDKGAGANQSPQIKELDLETKAWTRTWNLDGLVITRGQGVEAMTYVPSTAVKNDVGGYFIASSTGGDTKTVLLYDVGAGASGTLKPLPSANTLASAKASDFYYSTASKLYVAYDDEGTALQCIDADNKSFECPKGTAGTTYVALKTGSQKAEVYSWSPPANLGAPAAVYPLLRTRGLEGITEVQGALYTSIDMSNGQNPGTLAEAPKKNRPIRNQPDDDTQRQVALIRANLDTIDLYDLCRTQVKSCGEIKGSSCGWCRSAGSSGEAMLGTAQGPQLGTCDNWFWNTSDCGCAATTQCGQIAGNCGWCRSLGSNGQPMLGTKEGGPRYPSVCANWFWKSSDCSTCADLTACSKIAGKTCGWCFSLGTGGQPMLDNDHRPAYGSCADYVWNSSDPKCKP